MILNYGPKGAITSNIDFKIKFDLFKDLLFSYNDKVKVLLETAEEDNICSLVQNDNNWDLKILQDCIIIFNKKITTNLFLVSGGGKGMDGSQSGDTYDTGYDERYHVWAGGQGGYGGNVLLKENESILKDYQIQCIIGQGATATTSNAITTTTIKIFNENNQQISNNENYSALEQLIDNNLNRNYGIGGFGKSYSYDILQNNTNSNIQNNNIDGYLFHGNKYGAGGGGGGASLNTTTVSSGGDGGINGGGKGGGHISNNGAYNGDPGIPNTGSGGGGGAACNYVGSQYKGTGGDGGSGVIIISNY